MVLCSEMSTSQLSREKNIKALIDSVCLFPWCKYSHHVGTNMLLNAELGRDVHDHLVLKTLYELAPAHLWVQSREMTGPRSHK